MLKRAFDVIISLLLIILLAPILILISLAIKLTSSGPIIFSQQRNGMHNKKFTLFKFRTMICDAPNVATELLKDSVYYITPVGSLLRKTSFDELPQLFNILFGRMTFVGPRPALYNQYELIEMRTKEGVDKLVPGVTGLAQINGRDELNEVQKVGFDKEYLENKSMILDMKIFYKTVFKVIRADGVVEGGKSIANQGKAGKNSM